VKQLLQSQRELKKQLAGGTVSTAQEEPSTARIADRARPSGEASDAPVAGAGKGGLEGTPGGQLAANAELKQALRETARVLNVAPFDALDRVCALLADIRRLEQQRDALADSPALSAETLLAEAEDLEGVKVVVAETPGANPQLMRQLIDQIRQRAGASAVMLATAQPDQKVVLVAGASRDLVARGISAGDWIRQVAPVVGGGGGGKPDMAQAGGKQPEKLPEALAAARSVIGELLSGA
jgi:alanyl-tRNA synthetase